MGERHGWSWGDVAMAVALVMFAVGLLIFADVACDVRLTVGDSTTTTTEPDR